MLDCGGVPPDLSLCLGADDQALFVCASSQTEPGWRGKPGQIYVVVHRGQGVWTHVCRVVQDAGRGRGEVFIEKVLAGEQADAACRWARDRFAARLGGDHPSGRQGQGHAR